MIFSEFLNKVKNSRMNFELLSFPFIMNDKNICIFFYEIEKEKSKDGILFLKKINKLFIYNIQNEELLIEDNLFKDISNLELKVIPMSIKELKKLKEEYNQILNSYVNDYNNEDILTKYTELFSCLVKDDFKLIYTKMNCY